MPRDYPPRTYNNPAPPAPDLLLDLVPNAGAAYSLRRVKSDYTGSLIRVRRSSDASETDIGFTSSNDLDITTLMAFVGSGSGFIKTWYDQSGNARDITQALTANQPMIVNSGVLNTQNGKPAVKGDGSTSYLQNTSPFMYGSGAVNIHTVLQGASGQASATHVSETSATSANPLYDFRPSATNADTPAQIFRNDANSNYLSNNTTGTQVYLNSVLNTLTHVDTSTTLTHFVNGNQSFTGPYARTGVSSMTRFTMFASGRPTVQAFFNGHISEMIIYGLNNTTPNRQLVEANQKTYFGTP